MSQDELPEPRRDAVEDDEGAYRDCGSDRDGRDQRQRRLTYTAGTMTTQRDHNLRRIRELGRSYSDSRWVVRS